MQLSPGITQTQSDILKEKPLDAIVFLKIILEEELKGMSAQAPVSIASYSRRIQPLEEAASQYCSLQLLSSWIYFVVLSIRFETGDLLSVAQLFLPVMLLNLC